MTDPVCKNCKYRQLCRESPIDFSCSDVKKLAELCENTGGETDDKG